MEDLKDADPVNIHKDSCSYYQNRDITATTTQWHLTETLEQAEQLARRLTKTKRAKHAGCCLDNTFLT